MGVPLYPRGYCAPVLRQILNFQVERNERTREAGAGGQGAVTIRFKLVYSFNYHRIKTIIQITKVIDRSGNRARSL